LLWTLETKGAMWFGEEPLDYAADSQHNKQQPFVDCHFLYSGAASTHRSSTQNKTQPGLRVPHKPLFVQRTITTFAILLVKSDKSRDHSVSRKTLLLAQSPRDYSTL